LVGFAEGLLEYHNQCTTILKDICKKLNEKYLTLKYGPFCSTNNQNFSQRKKSIPPSYKQSVNRNTTMGTRKSSDVPTSRFYDDAASSNSSYSDHHRPSINPKYPVPPPISTMPQVNLAPVGFKIPYDTPTSSTSSTSSSIKMPAPPVNQRINNNISNNINNSMKKEPSCRAVYDFDAENFEELEFKEGDIIRLVSRLDENWYEGELRGRRGRFPASYVEILVPI
jgi:hypothetical protein